MQQTLTTIPLSRTDGAGFFAALAGASDQQLDQVRRLVDALPAEQLSVMARAVIPICYDERFLAMVYKSRAVGAKLDTLSAVSLLQDVTLKTRNLLLDEDVHQRLATGLVRSFGCTERRGLLPYLADAVHSYDPSDYKVQFGSDFDDAFSKHVRSTPYRSKEDIRQSWRTLGALELPLTLEALCGQLIAGGEYGSIERYIVDAFKSDALPDAYTEVFRRILGDDTVISLCASTHQVFSGPFSSAAKIIAWAGEEPFHTEKFMAGIQKGLRGRDSNRTVYLDGFAIAGADESRYPILASFALQSMKSILRDPREVTEIKFIVPLMQMASRLGKGKQALRLMLNGMMRRNLTTFIDGIEDATPGEVVRYMIQNFDGSMPRANVMAHWSLLLKSVEAVGLEALKQVIPGVDGVFVQRFLETKNTELSKASVLKMFPQAKRFVLESDLGL